MRKLYSERHDTFLEAAASRLPGLLDVHPTRSGLHTIAHLRSSRPESEIARAADARRITAAPIERYSLAPTATRGLVLGFGGVRPAAIEAGVDVLAQVLDATA